MVYAVMIMAAATALLPRFIIVAFIVVVGIAVAVVVFVLLSRAHRSILIVSCVFLERGFVSLSAFCMALSIITNSTLYIHTIRHCVAIVFQIGQIGFYQNNG
jgi:hypothetical protein